MLTRKERRGWKCISPKVWWSKSDASGQDVLHRDATDNATSLTLLAAALEPYLFWCKAPLCSWCCFCVSFRWFETRGGNQVQQMYLHWRHLPGEAELNRESAGECVHDGGGVVWKCDRQGHRYFTQTQVSVGDKFQIVDVRWFIKGLYTMFKRDWFIHVVVKKE